MSDEVISDSVRTTQGAKDPWLAEIRFDFALIFYRHRIAVAVHGLADGQPDPALADAILFHIVAIHPIEKHPHAPLQKLGIVEGAGRVGGKPVGQLLGDFGLSWKRLLLKGPAF
jgi:hypothetical protein